MVSRTKGTAVLIVFHRKCTVILTYRVETVAAPNVSRGKGTENFVVAIFIAFNGISQGVIERVISTNACEGK